MTPPPVVIIGSGAAGLSAALMLAGRRAVTLITKGEIGDGATAWAQGGLAAVSAANDSYAAHVADTLVAGAGLCEEDIVSQLVSAAPEAIARLVGLGATFDRTADGSFDLGLEGGHSARRIVHAGGDASGAEVARTLAAAVRRVADDGQIAILEHTWAVDAILDARGAVAGVRVMDRAGRTDDLAASALVLATGGIGQLWQATTNPGTATGDGLALAARAGAVLRDVEFVQFHPTLLAVPTHVGDRGVLVTEALRGEGAVLVDDEGRRVMVGVHPLADLAPRDVVSAAMHEHLQRYGGSYLYLDGTAIDEQTWQRHFPTVLQLCRERGVDPVTEPIPVRPGAHYHCGGVSADLTGRTSVEGLFAIGEVACTGVQGANRLASNSVTEALVAGHACGQALCADRPQMTGPLTDVRVPASGVRASARERIVAAMSEYAAVSRNAAGLATLEGILAAIQRVTPADPAALEAGNLLLVAELIAAAAVRREESRGCHRRSDYPQSDPAWQQHIDLRLATETGRITVMTHAVEAA
ncbi:L-aspartate oxidase [Cumulibacter soli]|uniref:L-aspartate oxidase n=1 Tax=Cumulibacter soli TaxID=2546344 RepID=UPI001068A466|nr:L-aspartate oxidase [Cumulibacter soli]